LLVTGEQLLLHRFPEIVHEGMRLGRHLALDGRSLLYTVERDVEAMLLAPKPADWTSPIPTLDQGQLGSCTGNAGTYALAALVGLEVRFNGWRLSATDAEGNENFAVDLYHEATLDDGFPGEFPPDDTGSSGLGVCRALKAAGLIGAYHWATTMRGFAAMLQRGGAIIGMPWYEAFFDPDANGFIDVPAWEGSAIAGGHELYVEALETYDTHYPERSVIRFHNSWGENWGDHGRGRMRLATYQALRQQTDVKQLAR
jgi:hypothetical protein